MKGDILISSKELNRASIMEKLVNGQLKTKDAAKSLNISIRQVRRLKIRYVKDGIKGLIHKSKGRVGNRAFPKETMEKTLKIIKTKYSDFGPTLVFEKLSEDHGINVNRETLRKAMIASGIWKEKRRKHMKLYKIRKRRSREGELVQADGSPHAWFEERGEYCNLLVFIDDATGKLKYLQFVKEETTNGYFEAMYTYIKAYGKPLALYVDKHSVFRTTRYEKWSGECWYERHAPNILKSRGSGDRSGIYKTAWTNDTLPQTQFTRAMKELNIEVICANSPQAKGRVEKVNRTLQDRLVKDMRLKGVKSIEEGNRHLPSFISRFNQRFAVVPEDSEDAHRPLLPSDDLQNILIKKEARILSRNLTFQYKGSIYQVDEERPLYAMRHMPIELHEDWSDNLTAYYKNKLLRIRKVNTYPSIKVTNSKELTETLNVLTKRRRVTKPSADHPWRRFAYK